MKSSHTKLTKNKLAQMKLSKKLLMLTPALMLSGCIVVATPSHADFHVQKNLSIDASDVSEFEVEAGAGSLTVVGDESLNEIQVTADIYTDRNNPDNYILELTERNGTVYLVAKNRSTSGVWNGDSPKIDVRIRTPKHLGLEIDDGSGPMSVNNISGDVRITDGSGSTDINEITGSLDVKDGSGSLTVSNVKGNVSIDDGSGHLEMSDIKGSVKIDDGSGSIVAKRISGAADIEDGSGDLTVRNVDGPVTIDDGSGSINVENVGGLNIIDAGSGGLHVKGVEGNFQIDS